MYFLSRNYGLGLKIQMTGLHLYFHLHVDLCIVLPVFANLFELNKEITKWTTDNDTTQILQPWIYHMQNFYTYEQYYVVVHLV